MVASDSLRKLAQDYWETRLREDPILATSIGDRRFDGEMPDETPEGFQRRDKEYRLILQRCQEIETRALASEDRVTLMAMREDVASQINLNSSGLDEFSVDPLGGPQVALMNLESIQPVRTPTDGRAMVRRWREIGSYLEVQMSNLGRGADRGKVAVEDCVEKVIDEIEDLMKKPDREWPLLKPLSAPHGDWNRGELDEFENGLTQALRGAIRPGFSSYLGFLKSEILPRARPKDRPGLMYLAGGRETYLSLIRVHTSLDLTPDELHSKGLEEVSRINSEMEDLGEKVFGTRERSKILQELRTDPSLYFSSRDEVAAKAETALARAEAAIPKWFGNLPKAECDVVRMQEHEEKHSTIAYYLQPAADGSRPGRYYINTSDPKTRPRYEAEALAYHESIPGHHLQIAIAQELEGVPDFRRHSGVTAFVEGWGLYAERLAWEMGLYSSDLDRLGALSYDSWRACRLVVDTGMHAKAWTRAQAINFMLENSALAENNIVNEVDRYISWPGQALAYKTGQLEILSLRRKAQHRLGKKFNIKEFHDALLKNGAVPLQTLREIMEEYMASAL
jgi:uncharacterized protein (DUF885 family)